jgi:hypothetical protein
MSSNNNNNLYQDQNQPTQIYNYPPPYTATSSHEQLSTPPSYPLSKLDRSQHVFQQLTTQEGQQQVEKSNKTSINSFDSFPLEQDLSEVDKDLIFEGLKKLYKKKVLPLELASKFSHFSSPPMSPSDFDAKPMVLILGQYSVGKTSFIRSLLKQDFPGQRIGPGIVILKHLSDFFFIIYLFIFCPIFFLSI